MPSLNNAEESARSGKLAGPSGSGMLWLVLLTATAAGLFSLYPAGHAQAIPQKTAPSAQDNFQQLDGFEDLIRSGKFHEVQTPLRDYLKAHPHSARAYYDLGYASFRTHQVQVSVEALAKSLQLDLNNAEAHKILGLDLIMIGKNDEAQIELEQAVRLEPTSAEIHYFLGRIHFSRTSYRLAKNEFEEAIRLDPSYVKAYDNLGLALEGMGEDNAALASFQKAFALMERQGRKSEWPYFDACAMYNRRNEPERAVGYCTTAIQVNPRNDHPFFELARAYIAEEKWEPAAAALQRAIQNSPRYPRYHFVLSVVDRKMGKAAESRKEMETFQKLSGPGAGQPPQGNGDRSLPEPDEPSEVNH